MGFSISTASNWIVKYLLIISQLTGSIHYHYECGDPCFQPSTRSLKDSPLTLSLSPPPPPPPFTPLAFPFSSWPVVEDRVSFVVHVALKKHRGHVSEGALYSQVTGFCWGCSELSVLIRNWACLSSHLPPPPPPNPHSHPSTPFHFLLKKLISFSLSDLFCYPHPLPLPSSLFLLFPCFLPSLTPSIYPSPFPTLLFSPILWSSPSPTSPWRWCGLSLIQ